jgi:hypothetical protein
MAGGRVLHGACAVVIMLSPLETGTTRSDAGNAAGAGRPAPRASTWPRGRRAAKTRQLASRRGEAGHGPSISYMEGPCLILPAGTCCRVRHLRHLRQLRNAGGAGCGDLGSGRAGRASPGRRAGPEAVIARASASATDPCRTARVRARKTGCRAVASSDASGGPAPRQRRLPAGDQLLNLVVDWDRRLPLRLVAVVAQAEGQRWRRLGPGSLSVSRRRGRRDHGDGDSRRAAGDAAARPTGCAASIRCPPSGAMSSRRRPDPRPGCRPPPAIPGTLTRCLPACQPGTRTCYRLCCA